MRILAKLIVILFTLFAFTLIVGFIFNFSIVFPFTVTNDITDVPEHRLQAVRLAAAATFAYFGIRYLFFQTTKLFPIQFLGVFLFWLSTIGSIVFYKYQLSLSEYTISFFWLITSVVLYQAGKPEFRSYFKKK
tara:strand:- start:1553 stop:1951 length:399 start_codon:yes stop_codon:yes gene_type:complete